MYGVMRHLVRAVLLLILGCVLTLSQAQYHFQDPTLPAEKHSDNLLPSMTSDERIGSMGTFGVLAPRLGIRGTLIGEALSGVVLGGPMDSLMAAIPMPKAAKTAASPTALFPQGTGIARDGTALRVGTLRVQFAGNWNGDLHETSIGNPRDVTPAGSLRTAGSYLIAV